MNLLDIDFDVRVTGMKTSEGDGRTAADIEKLTPCERGTCGCEQPNAQEDTDAAR